MLSIQLFILALVPCCLLSQNYVKYHNLINEAEFDMNNGRWSDAKIKLTEAFSLEKPKAVDLFMLPKCYCMLGEKQKAKKHVKKAASQSGFLNAEKWVRYDSVFYRHCFNDVEFASLKKDVDILMKDFSKKWSESDRVRKVRDTISYFFTIDQKYRSLMNNSPCKDRADTTFKCRNFIREWMLSDSILQENVYSYILNNGFPVEADEDIYIMLSHLNKTIYEKMRPLLYRELQKGRVEPFFYGMIVDRLEYLYNSKTCTYYVFSQDCSHSTWESIKKYRKEVGMSIYYNGPRRGGYGNNTILPWMKNTNNN